MKGKEILTKLKEQPLANWNGQEIAFFFKFYKKMTIIDKRLKDLVKQAPENFDNLEVVPFQKAYKWNDEVEVLKYLKENKLEDLLKLPNLTKKLITEHPELEELATEYVKSTTIKEVKKIEEKGV